MSKPHVDIAIDLAKIITLNDLNPSLVLPNYGYTVYVVNDDYEDVKVVIVPPGTALQLSAYDDLAELPF